MLREGLEGEDPSPEVIQDYEEAAGRLEQQGGGDEALAAAGPPTWPIQLDISNGLGSWTAGRQAAPWTGLGVVDTAARNGEPSPDGRGSGWRLAPGRCLLRPDPLICDPPTTWTPNTSRGWKSGSPLQHRGLLLVTHTTGLLDRGSRTGC